MAVRRVLFVFRHGPHGTHRARDGLDAALAAVAFDHCVSALFLGDGVLLLMRGHDTAAAGVKDFAPGFRALLHHGLERAVVAEATAVAFGVTGDDLAVPTETLGAIALPDWIAEHDAVFAF